MKVIRRCSICGKLISYNSGTFTYSVDEGYICSGCQDKTNDLVVGMSKLLAKRKKKDEGM